ncbi:MAG: alpha/beta hydrolase [Chloroflexota bacterium]
MLDFIHYTAPARRPGLPTLLLLHGTGGDERSLLPLAANVLPDAAILSPRGKVLEHGMPRFFRRLAEGVFDLPDLHARTDELAAFIEAATAHYNLAGERLIAMGYSNGANMAGSLLLQYPTLLAGAVLLRPMVPFEPDQPPDLHGRRVLIVAGQFDSMVPAAQSQRLADLLMACGAEVNHHILPADHGLTNADLTFTREWLAGA